MNYVINFLLSFVVVYLVYFIFVISRKKIINKIKTSLEARLLITKYKVDVDKINSKELASKIALCNSLIVSLVYLVTLFINNFILSMLVGFVIFLILIFVVYKLLGKNLKKKEGN